MALRSSLFPLDQGQLLQTFGVPIRIRRPRVLHDRNLVVFLARSLDIRLAKQCAHILAIIENRIPLQVYCAAVVVRVADVTHVDIPFGVSLDNAL